VFLGFLLFFGLAGCSPKEEPFIAVTVVGDQPAVLIAECARDEVNSVNIWEERSATATASPGDLPAWAVMSWVDRVDASPERPVVPAPARITFFDVPPGWRVVGSEDTLHEFRDGQVYVVSAGPPRSILLTFTLAQLRGMAPGDVLTSVNSQHEVVSEARFQEVAGESCDN
jgi:hypothetical protein